MPINNIAIVLVNTSIRYDTNIYILVYIYICESVKTENYN